MRETQTICRTCCRPKEKNYIVYKSDFLKQLAPQGVGAGYDTIVHIGKLRFLKFLQIEEIQSDLNYRGLKISTSSISRHANYFLAAIECLHYSKIKKLQIMIEANGGYLLHIDATTEKKSCTVFVCLDRITGVVLLSEKIPTEKEEHVEKQLKILKKYFGNPLSIMRDMGKSMGNPANTVFKGVPDRICQFHFLDDVGSDLMSKLYVELGQRLVKLKINANLNRLQRDIENNISLSKFENISDKIQNYKLLGDSDFYKIEEFITLHLVSWIKKYTDEGTGLGFPFDRLRLSHYRRINYIKLKLTKISNNRPGIIKKCENLNRLRKIVHQAEDITLRKLIRDLKKIGTAFDKLRDVLRFKITKKAPLTKTIGVRTVKEIRSYNKDVVKYTKKLLSKEKHNTLSFSEKIILTHLEKYQTELLIPEELVDLFQQGYLDRTNNEKESMFRKDKQGERRRSGKKDISREFNYNGPQLPLMRNLTNDNYTKAIVGEIEDIPLRLSELNQEEIKYYLEKMNERRKGKLYTIMPKLQELELIH